MPQASTKKSVDLYAWEWYWSTGVALWATNTKSKWADLVEETLQHKHFYVEFLLWIEFMLLHLWNRNESK